MNPEKPEISPEHALEILVQADEIKSNAELMQQVKALGKEKSVKYRSISDLRKRANELAMAKDSDAPDESPAEDTSDVEEGPAEKPKKKSKKNP